jgi:hypothetical protein
MGDRVLCKRAAMARFILRTVVTTVVAMLLLPVASYSALAQTIGEPARLNSIKLFDGSQFDPDTVKGKRRVPIASQAFVPGRGLTDSARSI